MTTNDALLIKILTADKGESYTMRVHSKYAEAIITEIKRLLKSRASEYSFEIHDDGYLLITRL
jgi:response regulator RpfG family c-di-GMP phosphodiesterase